MQFKETPTSEIATAVATGTVDMGDMNGSKAAFEEIRGHNANGELTGDTIVTERVDHLGYGYIGINAGTVNVGGVPGSEASRALRKGLATVLAAYRDVAVDSYYGDAASVINYPSPTPPGPRRSPPTMTNRRPTPPRRTAPPSTPPTCPPTIATTPR